MKTRVNIDVLNVNNNMDDSILTEFLESIYYVLQFEQIGTKCVHLKLYVKYIDDL